MSWLRAQRRLVAVLAAVVCGAGLLAVEAAVAPQTAAAAEIPWTCSPSGYLFQSPTRTTTTVYRVDLISGQYVTAGTLAEYVNGVGFNTLDNFMYGYDQTRDALVRISSDFTLTTVPSNIVDRDWNTGDVDAAGHLWLLSTVSGNWSEVDLAPGSPTYGQVLRSGTVTLTGANAPPDWSYINGALYGINQNGNLLRFNISASPPGFTNLGAVTGTGADLNFGAAYTDGTFLYVSSNASGRIYRVDLSTRRAVRLSTGPSSANNDGARCANSRFPTLTLTKNIVNRANPADQFTIELRDSTGTVLTSATTTGSETSVTTETFPLDINQTYTIADSLSAGPSTLADYTSQISCTNTTTGDPAGANGSPPTWSFTPTTTDDYACTVTNTGPPPEPQLSLTKSVAPSDRASIDVGQRLTYSFVVTNNGNVTLDDITIHEIDFSGSGTLSAIICPTTTLAPTESTTCTATYTVTQEDVDAGKITNLAQASGTTPEQETVESNEADAVVRPDQEPSLSVEKTADPTTATTVGTTIDYTFTVTNTGNVTIDDIAIDERGFTGSGSMSAITCDATTLAPTAVTTCHATYSVTQEDLDRGAINNSAVATGTAPGDTPVESPPDDASVTTIPKLSLTKSVSPSGPAGVAVGTTLTYTFTVTNESGVTITDVAITDFDFSGSGTLSPITCDVTTLDPTESTTCTATYTVTQGDVDAGQITNAAFATGSANGTAVQSPDADARVTIDQHPALSLTKTPRPATVHHAGDVVTYTLVVTNTGDVTITGIGILEGAFSGTGALSPPKCGLAGDVLPPGQSVKCTITYVVTQADIDAGRITNVATATGTNPGGETTSSPPADAVVTAPAAPHLTLRKSAAPSVISVAGQRVTYRYVVTNNGNVTIRNLAIAETRFTGTGTPPAATCPTTTLRPRQSTTCTATYTVTATDMTKPSITNTAIARGTTPSGGMTTSNPSTVSVEPARPALHLVKIGTAEDTNRDGRIDPGDRITWTFTVTNTGNIVVTGITVDDATAGTVSCPRTSLAPGASMTCTARAHTVNDRDAIAGRVVNTAVAHGIGAGRSVASNTARATIAVAFAPIIPAAAGAPIASTGADSRGGLVLGGLLLGAGLLLLLAGRRRRGPHSGS